MTAARARLITPENARWWTLGAMSFALFMVMLDNTVVNVALPRIQRDLDASIAGLEWVVNAYTLAFGVLLVTGGRLGDLFGRRRLFLAGVALFAAASAACGAAPSAGALTAARVVQGVGAALMMPATLSIITNAFPPHERGRAIGTWAGVSAVALAIGPLVGGALVEHASWRWIFYLNLPVAAGAILATLFAVRESRDETVERTVDYAGVALLTIGLGALVLALVEGNAWGWGSPRILGLFAIATLGLVAFAVAELRVRAPMVDFSFLRSRTFLGSILVALIISFAMFGTFFFVSLYLQNVRGYSPLEAGAMFLPATILIMIIAPLSGRMADRIGPRTPIVVGLGVVAFSLVLQSRLSAGASFEYLIACFVTMGIGIALVMSPMSTAAMNAVETAKAGLASGVLSSARMIGGTLGIAVLGAVFQGQSRGRLSDLAEGSLPDGAAERLSTGTVELASLEGLPDGAALALAAEEAFAAGLADAFTIAAVLAALGSLLALWLVRGRASAPALPPVGGVPAPGPDTAELQAAPSLAAAAEVPRH